MTKQARLKLATSEPWAILQENLEQIVAIAQRANNEPLEAVATRLGKPLNNSRTVTVRDGVAVIPVAGPVFRYANLFTDISGATSIEVLAQDFQKALDSPDVKSIVLDIDSPGGMVSGTSEFAKQVYSARGVKPVVAYVSNLGASAAYWIASATSSVVLADTAMVGSIGVVGTFSANKDDSVIELVSSQSPNKRPDIATDEGKQALQANIDALGAVFVETVANYRGVSAETVLSDFGGGGLFVGQDAVTAGLADKVSTLEAVITSLNVSNSSVVSKNPSGAKQKMLTIEQLKAEYPELVTAIQKTGFDEGFAVGRAEGVAYECDRIKGVEAQCIPGHEALVEALKFDGKTTGPEAAVKVLAAEKASATSYLAKIKADAPAPLAQPSSDLISGAVDKSLPIEEQCKQAWDKSPELRAEFGTIGAYTAYEKAKEANAIKILSR